MFDLEGKNIALMSRVSTDKQEKYGFSLNAQSADGKAFIIKHGGNLVYSFKEHHSAKNFNRPEWLLFLQQLNKLKLDYLLVKHWSRFSRNVELGLKHIRQFSAKGIEINAYDEWIVHESPASKYMLMMLMTAAEVDNTIRSKNAIEGRRNAFKNGYYPDNPPTGYVRFIQNNHASIIPGARFKIVKQFFQAMAMQDLTVTQWLQANKYPFPKSVAYRILKNEVYYGVKILKAYKKEPTTIHQGKWQAMIDEQTFILANNLRNKVRVKKYQTSINPKYPLRDSHQCPNDGKKLTASTSKGKKISVRYYHCQSPCKYRVNANTLENAFINLLETIKIHPAVAQLWQDLIRYYGGNDTGLKSINQLQNKIITIEGDLSELHKKFVRNKIEFEVYESLKNEWNIELSTKVDRLNELKAHQKINIIELSKQLNNLPALYKSGDAEVKDLIASSIYGEKLVYENQTYRTPTKSPLLQALVGGLDKFSTMADTKNQISNPKAIELTIDYHRLQNFLNKIKKSA